MTLRAAPSRPPRYSASTAAQTMASCFKCMRVADFALPNPERAVDITAVRGQRRVHRLRRGVVELLPSPIWITTCMESMSPPTRAVDLPPICCA